MSLGYQRHERAGFADVGALGGLSIAGRYAVGTDLSTTGVGATNFATSHSMDPYAGAHASILINPVLVSLSARRTFLLEEGSGNAFDQAEGQICWQAIPNERGGSFGGCVNADLFHGHLERESPTPGVGGEIVSFRLGFTIMFARVEGP